MTTPSTAPARRDPSIVVPGEPTKWVAFKHDIDETWSWDEYPAAYADRMDGGNAYVFDTEDEMWDHINEDQA